MPVQQETLSWHMMLEKIIILGTKINLKNFLS